MKKMQIKKAAPDGAKHFHRTRNKENEDKTYIQYSQDEDIAQWKIVARCRSAM